MTGSEVDDALARWDVLDEALSELRACRSSDDIAERVCSLAQRGCDAEVVALGTVTAGAWSVWCQAGPGELLGALAGSSSSNDVEQGSVVAEAVGTGRLASGPLPGGRRHLVVPLSGSETVWLLQLAAPADLGDLGLELAESFAAALRSTVALVALQQHADQQRHVIARLANGIGEVAERAVELADTPRPDSPLREPSSSSSSTASTVARLSPRQRDVLDLMVAGLSNAEIAERLVVTLPTVKSHVQAVLRAYGAVNRSDAITRIARGEAPTPAAPDASTR